MENKAGGSMINKPGEGSSQLLPLGLAVHWATLPLKDGWGAEPLGCSIRAPLKNPEKISSQPSCPGLPPCQGAVLGRRAEVMDRWAGYQNFLSDAKVPLPLPRLFAWHLFQVRRRPPFRNPSSIKRLAEGLLQEPRIKTSLRAKISVLTSHSYISVGSPEDASCQ